MSHRLILMLALLATSLMLSLSACRTVGPSPQAAQPEWLPAHTRLDALRAGLDVPGLAMAGVSRCSPTPPINIGASSLLPQVPVSDTTRFEAASLSKPVFAFLVMRLVDAGVIDLDRPLAKDFQYARIVDLQRYGMLTPRLILSHRSGLPNWVGDTHLPQRTDVIPFVSEPGGPASYSGEAYELLRAYVEYKTGKTLDGLFLLHLGDLMPHSGFAASSRTAGHAALGYASTRTPGDGRKIAYLGGAAGGLVTTAADYAQFIGMICRRTRLSPESHAQMFSPHTPITSGDMAGAGDWALGWIVMRTGPRTMILHDGNNQEFRSFAGFDPATGDGLVAFTNGRNGGDLIHAILDEVQ